MGKGMKAGKKPKQPKMGNAQQMAQMQAMQREMDKVQEEIEKMEASATSGGGAVTVTVTGKKEIKDIRENHYPKFGSHLPKELSACLDDLEKRLNA